MKKREINKKTKLELINIEGFFKRKVTKFGNSAKVDCPREFLDREVYLIIQENGTKKRSKTVKRRIKSN